MLVDVVVGAILGLIVATAMLIQNVIRSNTKKKTGKQNDPPDNPTSSDEASSVATDARNSHEDDIKPAENALVKEEQEKPASILDSEDWNILVRYDMEVASALEKVSELGNSRLEKFAEEVISTPPNERDPEAIADKFLSEYTANWVVSKVPEINDALKRAAELGDKAESKFRKIYELVGDHIDHEKLLNELIEDDVSEKIDVNSLSNAKISEQKFRDAELVERISRINTEKLVRILRSHGWIVEIEGTKCNIRIPNSEKYTQISANELPRFVYGNLDSQTLRKWR